MAVNKVVYDGNTLIDLTSDTVTADKLAVGYTAHGANGVQLTGTGEMLSDYFYISSGDLHTDYKLVINNNLSVAPDYNQTDGSYAQLDTDNEGGGGNIILKSGYEISSSNAYGGIVAAGALDGVTQTQSYGSGTSVSAPQGEARILATHGSMPYTNLTTKAMVEAIATETTSEVNIDATRLNVSGNIYLAHNKAIYGTNSNSEPKYVFEPRNASDNCAINYPGYSESNSNTEIYGNNISLTPRSKNTFNGTNVMNTCGAYTNDNVYRNIWHMSTGTNLVIGYGWYETSQRAYTTELQGNNLSLRHAAAFTVNGIDYANTAWVTPKTGCHYRKRAGWVVVVFDGVTWNGTGDATYITLPAGYRPGKKVNLLSVNGSNASVYMYVSTDGVLKFHRTSTSNSTYYNGVMVFPADN